MTTLAKHFARMMIYQQSVEDEIHKCYDHDHLKRGDERHMVNLSQVIHQGHIEIERARMLILKGEK